MSLEELMELEVSSVAKRPLPMSDSAAAVFIITHEDIIRSGVMSVPEALAMAPGVEVEPVNAWSWAISIRGGNGRFSNKLLVMIDGRSIYSPIFSGVFWDNHNLLLEDIERIEVIRGPGGSLWGANAVNGIINIITKKASDTKSTLMSVASGYPYRSDIRLRYGQKIREHFCYRIYFRHIDHERSNIIKNMRGTDIWTEYEAFIESGIYIDSGKKHGNDGWYDNRFGFRMDWSGTKGDELIFSGDWNFGKRSWRLLVPQLEYPYEEVLKDKIYKSPWNLHLRWKKDLNGNKRFVFKAYVDHDHSSSHIFGYSVNRVDLEAQYRFSPADNQIITLGSGYRRTEVKWPGNQYIHTVLSKKIIDYFHGFFQHELFFKNDSLSLIWGSKFEHNPYTDFEAEPNIRVRYSLSKNKTIWAAISRAVRTPDLSVYNANMILYVKPPSPPLISLPVAFGIKENKHYNSERMWAYECGYRSIVGEHFTFDLALFFNKYDKLLAAKGDGMPYFLEDPVPHFRWDFIPINGMYGESYGAEVSTKIDITPWWRLHLVYSYLRLFMHLRDDADEFLKDSQIEHNSPKHQLSIRSSLDLTDKISLDLWTKFIDKLTTYNNPSYLTVNAKISWKPRKNLDISLAAQNLIGHHRPGFYAGYLHEERTRVDQGFYGKIKWEF